MGGGAVSIFISTTHPHISMGEMRADSGYYHASLYFNKRYGSVITRDSATSERYVCPSLPFSINIYIWLYHLSLTL